jgi:Chitobiase/beta-hexosaminidase C-terminal domain/Legume lectin domain
MDPNTTNLNQALSASEKTVNRRRPLYCPEAQAFGAPGLWDALTKVFRETEGSRSLVVLSLAVMTLGLVIPASAQAVFNCSGFASSGSCGLGDGSQGSTGQPFAYVNGGALSGSSVILTQIGATHNSYNMQYQHSVNVQAFTTTFTFVPNGYNLGFTIQNCNNSGCPGGTTGKVFASGAGSEGGFSQFGGGGNIAPNNVFAMQLDSYNPLTYNGTFTYSSIQWYQTLQPPWTIGSYGDDALPLYFTRKVSTSPVPTNSPASSPGTTTGHTYSATIGYDGWTLSFCMYDVTAANGSCSSSTSGTGIYFTTSWTGVNIPSIVGGNTANIGFASGVGENPTTNLLISSWSYTANAPTGTPSFTAWNANSTYSTGGGATSAASPVYSVAPGTYSSTQSVSITTSTSPNSYICYVLSSGAPSFYPQPDNNGGCVEGTLYSSPISVSSSATLYAKAGSNSSAFSPGSTNPTGLGPPSTLVAGTYTITGGGGASTPTFSPAAGTYTSAQSVSISDATSGATIYYTTNGTTPTTSSTQYTGPITVSTTETLQAIAVATGHANSPVASATYTINVPVVATPTFSPAAGSYTTTQSVSISFATSGATIYYTTNGTTPTTSSTPYTGPITVNTTETLEAIAVATGDADSPVASATYTIDPPNPDAGNAPVINYPNGFAGNPAQLSLVNRAVYSGSSLELTNSGGGLANNAWYETPVNVQAFTTTFTWNAICPAKPASCGDGMGFMIISDSNPSSPGFKYSGYSGSQFSWSTCGGSALTDCRSINSILVKFDLYNNLTGTDGANLTGFYSGGVNPQPPEPENDMAPSGINMESGDLMKATLTYNGTVLMETVTDTVTGATYRNSYSANIPALVGGNTALVGFGGSSGGASVTQNIRSWTYTVESAGN